MRVGSSNNFTKLRQSRPDQAASRATPIMKRGGGWMWRHGAGKKKVEMASIAFPHGCKPGNALHHHHRQATFRDERDDDRRRIGE